MNKLTTYTSDQYRLLVEHIPGIAYTAILEQDGIVFRYISPQIETILGIHPSEWIDNPEQFMKHIHPEDRERVRPEHRASFQTQEPFRAEYRVIGSDGHTLWFRDEGNVMRGPDGVSFLLQGVMLNITDQKRLEDELLRWDREARTLTDHLPDIIARLDPRGRFLYLNRWFDASRDVVPEWYLGKTATELDVPDTISFFWEKSLRRVCHEKTMVIIEFSFSSSDGQKFFESRLVPEWGNSGGIDSILIVTRDLTEKKLAEVSLQESEERFRQLAESIADVFWLVDSVSQQFIYVSPVYEKCWGSSSQELYHNPEAWMAAVHPEDRMRVERSFYQKLGEGTLDIEYRILLRDGEIRWIHDRAYPIHNKEGKIYRIAGMAEDVTIRKQFEEERLRVSKLDSLGLLAGGLAHDFNNLLTAILGQLSLAKFFIASDNPLFPRLNEAEMASLRAQDLTQQLLTFAKGGTPIRKPASLSQIVEENSRFVLTGSNVKCEFHITKELWTVEVDVGQISQVVQNLVINAMQAMPDGGTITVFGQNITIESESSWTRGHLSVGHWVKVSFMDQGVGIQKEHVSKIFDPYFTTKPSGHGLGLATSSSIMKNHGGSVAVDSEIGIGTTFTIFLPASTESQIAMHKPSTQIRIGHGNILIMDDDAPIRKVLSEMLEVCGYSQKTATNGEETLAVFAHAQEQGTPFDAVILDLTIPGEMGGRIVIQKLLKIAPSVKAIVVSGYSNDPVLSNFQEYGFHGRISKPFRLGEVSEVLHSVLSS
ncbi:PAS domain-containing hybrid sensor histidine kinase/response regulator [Nitrospira sp. M1]